MPGKPISNTKSRRIAPQAAKLMRDAANIYRAGDKMTALRVYDQALDKGPTVEQRQVREVLALS